jgi:hypothetical protein
MATILTEHATAFNSIQSKQNMNPAIWRRHMIANEPG